MVDPRYFVAIWKQRTTITHSRHCESPRFVSFLDRRLYKKFRSGFVSYVVGPIRVQSGTRAFEIESALGMYGFMSIIGEPSMASSPLTVRVHPLAFISSTTHRPIGFGRDGLLQAKTPLLKSTACFLGETRRVLLSFSLSRR